MNDKSNQRKTESGDSMKYVCGDCGSKKIETIQEIYKFPYGVGDDAIELSCKVPVRHCVNCGSNFIDGEAEDLCHEEICKHLGVMNPKQVKDLRELYNLTQAEFSEITKLGEATLSRWERGIIIQNQAYDNYLYLLGFQENLARIHGRAKKGKSREPVVGGVGSIQFRGLDVNEELLERKNNFKLLVV